MSESVTLLEHSWQDLLTRVNTGLKRYSQLGSECPEKLRESITYSLRAGGKRLRPVLVLLGCEACGGDLESAMPAACAIEMVHTYSLIHDDLPAMDNDHLRRGRPTNHIVFGEAPAILSGDGLLTLAFEIVASEVKPPNVAAACCVDLATAAGVTGMVGGQFADLEAEGRIQATDSPSPNGSTSVDRLEAIHRRKTGALFQCALTMGARIAGAGEDTLDAISSYGKCVGLAFQITDDLLDLVGNQERVGKQVRKDSKQGKLTYPALLGEMGSREKAHELIVEACQSIEMLSDRGRRLKALAHFVLERDH